jgi:phage shock protein E
MEAPMQPGFHSNLFFFCLTAIFSTTLLAADPIWIDVRTVDEYNSGHVSEAVNIPYTEIVEGVSTLTADKDASLYIYCGSGRRSGIAKESLENLGYTQVINVGGVDDAMKRSAAESTRKSALETIQ